MTTDYQDNIFIFNFTPFNNNSNSSSTGDYVFEPNITVIVTYMLLFLIAAIGNLTVFISLFRSRHRRSRISLMIRHLAIADLIVTFVMIPIEVGWRITGEWIAGNVACKVFLFLRAFGPYLSSNVLVCVSLDRYFAVLHPLRVSDARRRGKFMLAVAWGASFVYCIPQSFVFSVMAHPHYPHYMQCVSFGFFTSPSQEVFYNLLCVMFMYFIPLFVIVVAYTAIMCEISKSSKPSHDETYRSSSGRMRLRRSDISNIERARSRTLRMTIMIVFVYVCCCTPYVVITLWYMINRESAKSLPEWLQDSFFMMVVSNSCVNPIVYGSYAINCKQNCKCCSCFGKSGLSRNMLGSGVTRSIPMMNAISRSPVKPFNKFDIFHDKKEPFFSDRPLSVANVSFSESSSSHARNSYHSEPLTNTYSILEQQTLALLVEGSGSEPNVSPKQPHMSPKHDVYINVKRTEAYYLRHDSSISYRTRNI